MKKIMGVGVAIVVVAACFIAVAFTATLAEEQYAIKSNQRFAIERDLPGQRIEVTGENLNLSAYFIADKVFVNDEGIFAYGTLFLEPSHECVLTGATLVGTRTVDIACQNGPFWRATNLQGRYSGREVNFLQMHCVTTPNDHPCPRPTPTP